jgi:plastocyanin
MRRLLFVCIAVLVVSPLALARSGSGPVDPREGGFEVAMGEWTVVPEAKAVRPGSITFVVANRGRFPHGLRIRSDANGGKDRFEARTRVLLPGQTARLTVDLVAGVYELECFVEDAHGDHGDLGMRATLEVRADAPLVIPPAKASNQVRIASFAFAPSPLVVRRGTVVRWVNDDGARHTVSARNGSFNSPELTKGQAYSRKFARAGTYVYLCAVHPKMQGKVVVR